MTETDSKLIIFLFWGYKMEYKNRAIEDVVDHFDMNPKGSSEIGPFFYTDREVYTYYIHRTEEEEYEDIIVNNDMAEFGVIQPSFQAEKLSD